MARMKDLATQYAELVEVITCWKWEDCMAYVCETPLHEVRRFIEENW